MLPLILVAVGAYLIGDSVLGDKKYAKGGMSDGGEKAAKKRLEELRKELRAEKISYGELAELESLKKYIDDDDLELLQAAGVPEYEDEDEDDDDKMAKGGKVGLKFYVGQSVLYKPTNNSKLDKAVRNLHNKYANRELVIEKIESDKPYNTAKVFDRNTGEKLSFDLVLNPRYVEQYAKGGYLADKTTVEVGEDKIAIIKNRKEKTGYAVYVQAEGYAPMTLDVYATKEAATKKAKALAKKEGYKFVG